MLQNNNDVYFKDIKSFSSEFSFLNKLQNATADRPIMSGHFIHQSFTDGLNIHTTDAVETQDTSISSEVAPSISFSFLFDGTIDFSIGNSRHHISTLDHQELATFIVINNDKQMFTRYLVKDMHVKKLTISMTKQWLLHRCQNDNDFTLVSALFESGGVFNWQPTASVIDKVKSLINTGNPTSLAGKLNTEHLTMEILAMCLDAAHDVIQHPESQLTTLIENNSSLVEQVNAVITFSNTLPEIAEQLNISVSTLQRNFKRYYGVTISDYITDKRLETAKKLLILNELSIGEVAYEVGYKHSSNFINAFKKKFAITPAAFVQLHKQRY